MAATAGQATRAKSESRKEASLNSNPTRRSLAMAHLVSWLQLHRFQYAVRASATKGNVNQHVHGYCPRRLARKLAPVHPSQACDLQPRNEW